MDQLQHSELGRTLVLVTPSVSERAAQLLPYRQIRTLAELSPDWDSLIVIGGGTLMDEAKFWRKTHAPDVRLIVIPSIWGSGAEVSPVVLLNRQGTKQISVSEEFLADIRITWPELAASIPLDLARNACGDAWAHALEAFLSPLASEDLRHELAEVIRQMLGLPLANDARWFDASAQACAAQAKASVGLVHGIAHSLEGPLRSQFPTAGWGHAKLCALLLWPVMAFNQQQSPRWERLMQAHKLDAARILQLLKDLHDPQAYQQLLPLLDQHWLDIVRDPCSRTNSALVRPASKAFFVDGQFQ
ncbi:MAG: iron-containing alcohol dehydrogenase [Gammaproteobacteria bacterium]|nr:iron-containing alcohol dehydrogenase [Gammaproteobacteria bacterium]